MPEQTIGVKELHANLPKIARQVQRGVSFVVLKHTTPLFRIEPIKKDTKKTYSLKDFEKLQFHSGEKNLSKKIDAIVYGK